MVKKSEGKRLEPLNAKIENNAVFNYDERKLSHRLNPLPNKHAPSIDQKRVRSKIPVLQKKTFCPKQKKDDIYCDTSLSAADRRQMFQQSRLRVVGTGNFNIDPLLSKHPAAQYCDVFPWYESFIFHKVVPPPPVVNQRNVLPPIKPAIDASVGSLQKINQTKNKCLLGEFTHFPALCNPVCLKERKHYTSTVPHLPPIMLMPPAPPPSISTSLEKDGNHIDKRALHNKWNTSNFTFPNVIPVSF